MTSTVMCGASLSELAPASLVSRALASQHTGQAAKNELLAETPVKFFQRGSKAMFTFEGDGGRTERLVVKSGGQRRTATRRK